MNPIIAAGSYTVLSEPLTNDSERAYVAGFPPSGVFMVAVLRENGMVVGLQSVEPWSPQAMAFSHVATIGTFVHLSYRREGVGRRLFEETAPAVREKGFEKLLTYVRQDNPSALAYYRALGFRVVGVARRQARIGRRYFDEVIIEKLLVA